MKIDDPSEFRELYEKYESRFGEPEIGSAEVGFEEYCRLLTDAIKTGKPIRRSDHYSEGAIT